MADAVTTQVLQDGEHLYVAKFTNISDGAGEDKVTKVDVSALNPNSHGLACIGMKISKLYAQTDDIGVDVYWVGDPTPANDALCVTLPKVNYMTSLMNLRYLIMVQGIWELTLLEI